MRPSASLDLRARILLPLLILALAGLTLHRLQCAPLPGPHVEFAGSTMGTTYMVKVASAELDAAAQRNLAVAIDERLDRIVALMSTYESDSELVRLNAHKSDTPFPVSPETLEVFLVAREVSELSSGAFDVTVAPLVRAWGFGAGAADAASPSPTELGAIRQRVGYRALEIDADARTIRKQRPDLESDLSAIAKGYAVDQIAEVLESRGYASFLVEVGGELRARGRRLDGHVWRIAIERPDEGSRNAHEILALEDMAIATSGDYRNYYEREGVRVSHTIDPRDGRPIRHTLASVSVVHPRAVYADALATALNVLGPQKGYALAERLDLPALFITRIEAEDPQESQFESRATAALDRLRRSAQIETQAP